MHPTLGRVARLTVDSRNRPARLVLSHLSTAPRPDRPVIIHQTAGTFCPPVPLSRLSPSFCPFFPQTKGLRPCPGAGLRLGCRAAKSFLNA